MTSPRLTRADWASLGLDPHFSSLNHPGNAWLCLLIETVLLRAAGDPSSDAVDAAVCYAVQKVYRPSRWLSAWAELPWKEAARAADGTVQAFDRPDGGLFDVVLLGRPETAEEAHRRLDEGEPLLRAGGCLLLFNSRRGGVRRAVETRLCDRGRWNHYLHLGSGVYLLGSHATAVRHP